MKDQILPNSSSPTARRPYAAGLLLRMTLAVVLALSGLLIAGPAWAEEQAGEQVPQQEAVDTPALPDVTPKNAATPEEGDEFKEAAKPQVVEQPKPTSEAVEQSSTLSASQSYEPQEIDSGTCGGSLTWLLAENGTLTISGTGAMPDYFAPHAPWQKNYANSIETVIIESGVTSIGSYAFSHCTALASVTIPNSVATIGNGAFDYCTALTSVTIPNNVTSVNDYAFYNCTSLTSLTIPNNVTSIGLAAFAYCAALPSVTIPNSVTSIGQGAFKGCTSLTSLAIPSSVNQIGYVAFDACDSLTSFSVDPSNANYSSDASGVLFNRAKTTLIQFPSGNTQQSYTIPNSVTSIEDYAFHGLSSLTPLTSLVSVIIPSSVTSIGYGAFADCTSLTSLIVPSSVAKIGTYAFLHCKGPIYCEAPSKPSGWNSDWSAGYTGEIIWGWGAPPADTKAPTLSKASATRASATTAKVSFTSSEAGSYYRAVVTKGAKTPAVNTTGAGSALKAGSQSLTVGGLVSTKAYDIYLIGKDAAGNISTKLKVSVSAWKAGFTGWKKTGSQWYYYKAGTKQKNTALSIQGKIYSFSATGAMITGWAKIKGVKRYHDSEGIAVKGWKKIGKNWYYFKTKGAGMATGAQKIGAAWYVFAGGNSGRMLTGWQKVGTSRYYLRGGSDGRAYTGWVKSGKSWYYFNPKTAKMASGWQKISGRYYYLSGANDGHMVTGTKTIKGVKYRFNASGALVSPKLPKK